MHRALITNNQVHLPHPALQGGPPVADIPAMAGAPAQVGSYIQKYNFSRCQKVHLQNSMGKAKALWHSEEDATGKL